MHVCINVLQIHVESYQSNFHNHFTMLFMQSLWFVFNHCDVIIILMEIDINLGGTVADRQPPSKKNPIPATYFNFQIVYCTLYEY